MARKGDGLYKVNGRPEIQADFTHKGVRVHRSTGCTSLTDARKWKKERIKEIDENVKAASLASNDKLSLRQAADKFWDEHLQYALGAEESEKYRLATIVDVIGERTWLHDLNTAAAQKYISWMQNEGYAASTIVRHLNLLRAMWGHAMEIWEYPIQPIAWRRIRPKVPKVEPIKITMPQARTLLDLASARILPIVKFALLTGMRKQEILRLKWTEVVFDAHTVTITDTNGQTVETLMSVLRFKGKGAKVAEIPINSEAVSLLSSMQRQQSDLVFDATNFRKEWEALRTSAGLQHITFHSLRHAHATILDGMNAPIQGIKRLLRHSDISTTLIYANADTRAALPYLEKLGEMFTGSQTKKSSAA